MTSRSESLEHRAGMSKCLVWELATGIWGCVGANLCVCVHVGSLMVVSNEPREKGKGCNWSSWHGRLAGLGPFPFLPSHSHSWGRNPDNYETPSDFSSWITKSLRRKEKRVRKKKTTPSKSSSLVGWDFYPLFSHPAIIPRRTLDVCSAEVPSAEERFQSGQKDTSKPLIFYFPISLPNNKCSERKAYNLVSSWLTEQFSFLEYWHKIIIIIWIYYLFIYPIIDYSLIHVISFWYFLFRIFSIDILIYILN